MTNSITTALMGCTVVALSLQAANAQERAGPEALPRDFVSQLYKVSEDSVTTQVIERSRHGAKVQAVADGHRCTFEMVRAPANVTAPSGWLAGGMACD